MAKNGSQSKAGAPRPREMVSNGALDPAVAKLAREQSIDERRQAAGRLDYATLELRRKEAVALGDATELAKLQEKERNRPRRKRERFSQYQRDETGVLTKKGNAQTKELVPATREQLAQIDWLMGWLTSLMRDTKQRLPADAPKRLEQTFAACFDSSYRDRWANVLTILVRAAVQHNNRDVLRKTPTELLSVIPHPLVLPQYVTRGLVRWMFDHIAPGRRSGRGRLTFKGMHRLLLNPYPLAERIRLDAPETAEEIEQLAGTAKPGMTKQPPR